MTNSFVQQQMSTELTHHGVKGMKWGVRKEPDNPNYSDTQRKRDKQLYGKRAPKRINKKMNRGDTVTIARSEEKKRRDKTMNNNKYARQSGKIAGAAVGVVGTEVAMAGISRSLKSKTGRRAIDSMFGQGSGAVANGIFDMVMTTPGVRVMVDAGGAKMASMFGGDLAVKANKSFHGYDPNRQYK